HHAHLHADDNQGNGEHVPAPEVIYVEAVHEQQAGGEAADDSGEPGGAQAVVEETLVNAGAEDSRQDVIAHRAFSLNSVGLLNWESRVKISSVAQPKILAKVKANWRLGT